MSAFNVFGGPRRAKPAARLALEGLERREVPDAQLWAVAGGTYDLNAVAVAYNAPNFEFDSGAGQDSLVVNLSVAGTTATAVTLSGGADSDALQVIGRNGLTATAGAAGVAVSGGPALTLANTESVDFVDFDSLTYTAPLFFHFTRYFYF